MRPITQPDGHDAPGLCDELVPGFAAVIDDVVEGFEDTVLPLIKCGWTFAFDPNAQGERIAGAQAAVIGVARRFNVISYRLLRLACDSEENWVCFRHKHGGLEPWRKS